MGRRSWLVLLAMLAATAIVPMDVSVDAAAAAPGATPPTGAPPVASTTAEALALARKSGRQVEAVAARTETGELFANPDGTFTSRESVLPVRVRRGTAWVPVDTTLKVGRDGQIRPVATPLTTVLSGGGSTPLVQVAWQGKDWAMGWPGGLPAPVLDGSTATYGNVLPDVDLVVTAGTLGFSEVLVVKNARAALNPKVATVHLTTKLTGLTTRTDAAGNVSAVDSAGTEVFRAGTPSMWDSSGEAMSTRDKLTGPATAARVRAMRVTTDAGGFVLRPDMTLLTDPQTRFPVFIDPNMAFAGTRTAWTAVWKKFPTTTYLNSTDVARVGFEAQEGNTVRSLFRMNLSTVRSKHIISATLRTFETHSWSCTARSVGLWQTGAFGSGTDWNNQPGRTTTSPLVTVATAKGYSASCPAGGVDFTDANLTNAVAARAAANAADITLELAALNETDTYAWKKFQNNPVLEVVYNSVPAVPTGMSTDPSLPCITGAGRPVIGTATPTFRARITDPDSGQPVGARFEWWAFGSTSKMGELVTPKVASGSVVTMTMPAEAFVNGKVYGWRVRAEDGTDVSAFTGFCELTIDTTKPKPPIVASTAYPETAPGQNPIFKGAIGVAGTFTFTPAAGDTDVASYLYGLTFPPATSVAASGTAHTATVSVTPTNDLLNTLWVQTKDQAGNISSTTYGYQFYVRPVTFPTGHWKFDETTGTTAADDAGDGRTAALTGGTSPTAGRIDGAVVLNGIDASAATAAPVLRTDVSFTVAAWVRLDGSTPFGVDAAVSQDGTVNSGFQLGYLPSRDRWVMSVPSADTTAATDVQAVATAPPATHTWSHLVGVYDKTAAQIRLYVDGVKVATVARSGPWNAGGALQIGRGKTHSVIGNWWNGAVDDVGVYQGVLPDEAISGLAHPPAALIGQWRLDETSGTTAADSSGADHPATITGGTSWGDGWVDGGLTLDGTSGSGNTASPVLRTDQAFTVTAWVSFRGPGAQPTNYTAVSQDGTGASGFKLGYQYGPNSWAVMMPASDSGDAADVVAASPLPPALNTWTHLAAVYDPDAQQLRLYVDGVLMALTTYSGGWQANGPLRIGRARWGGFLVDWWNGSIDDVRVYQGALTDDEIFQLTQS